MPFNSIRADFEQSGQQKILTALDASAALDKFGLDFAPVLLQNSYSVPPEEVRGDLPFTIRLPEPGGLVTFRSTYGSAGELRAGPHAGSRRVHTYHLKLFLAVLPASANLERAAMESLPWNEAVDRLYAANRTLDDTCHMCWLGGGDWTMIEYADHQYMGWLWDLFIELNLSMAQS